LSKGPGESNAPRDGPIEPRNRLPAGLNAEKLRALEAEGNVLVIANPGTGKTLLVANKYMQLVLRGVRPEAILCLTYTNKAAEEMRRAILKALREAGAEPDISKIKVNTFHAYALEAIGAQETMSENLLRYTIFRYLKDNEMLNYSEEHLLSVVVPKVEDSIRYLKSFGIMPDEVDPPAVQRLLAEYKGITKEEMDRYAEAFLDIFRHYEASKAGKGIDYADMLLEFRKLRKKPHYLWGLVDELQDANAIEAEMVLQSCETFFVVGDKKQAIFAFQGGSIVNFRLFQDSQKPVLCQNFRSTNEILRYARAFYLGKTSDEEALEVMRDLRNDSRGPGPKPLVYSVAREDAVPAACELVQRLRREGKRVAVIARTNFRIREISQELGRRQVEHSSTFFQASDEAQRHVIKFLLGVLSDSTDDLKNAMFTPFFPVSLRDAFALAQMDEERFRKELDSKCRGFTDARWKVESVSDVDRLFRERIVPAAVPHGREYLVAALSLQKAFAESFSLIGKIDLPSVLAYLRACDLAADESQREKDVVLTTVHKAKGKEFQAVVYLPQEVKGGENFQDEVVRRILETKGINVEQELEEEPLRIDFVALTRAVDELHVLAENAQGYMNEFAEEGTIELGSVEWTDASERLKRAFSLFVNGEHEKAKELLESRERWLRGFIRDWFDQLDHVSFSSLPEGNEERAAQGYLASRILELKEASAALELGSQVHFMAKALFMGEASPVPEKLESYAANVRDLMDQVRRDFPEAVGAEHEIRVPLQGLIGEGGEVTLQGRIDAIFRNAAGEYLLVDWKTDKNQSRASTHRQQLQAYRHAFALSSGVPLEKVSVAIGYLGLMGRVNLGTSQALLDQAKPRDSSFETFKRRVRMVLQWKQDPDSFLRQLGDSGDLICRAVGQEFESESRAA
jgi:DNA helicase-2/ATP-dependent DNA helicase PcrA